ncbi:hypothetical protein CYMTET_3407 [Cymbomonas tetramitiformis]|uniref:Uncharacterized protein n=1 Tax=Cymbomonas tetramitiformis TaxID=36881 RepID=A0AAE0H3H0_9CHLO|nr:hypothetical protein CYMTET_3407 [Cymbomonas tetramitiformis]
MLAQFRAQNAEVVVSSVADRGLPPKYGLKFMDWLKTMIWEIWTDPICGDGICEAPFEFPSYGRFGCKVDCGAELNVETVVLDFEVDFYLSGIDLRAVPPDVAEILRSSATWNVCEYNEQRRATGAPEICWYEKEQGFDQTRAQSLVSLSLPRGKWYVRMVSDYLESVRCRIMKLSDVGSALELPTFCLIPNASNNEPTALDSASSASQSPAPTSSSASQTSAPTLSSGGRTLLQSASGSPTVDDKTCFSKLRRTHASTPPRLGSNLDAISTPPPLPPPHPLPPSLSRLLLPLSRPPHITSHLLPLDPPQFFPFLLYRLHSP